jgi:hypothetical protein
MRHGCSGFAVHGARADTPGLRPASIPQLRTKPVFIVLAVESALVGDT